MPAMRIKRPIARTAITTPNQTDPTISRGFDAVVASIGELEARAVPTYRAVVNLAIGSNAIVHGLGRPAKHLRVTPTVASAAFAAALTSSDERTAIVTVIGAAQPGAGVELS